MKALIAYFSRSGEHRLGGVPRMLEVGNTETAAYLLQTLTGAELLKIEPLRPYSADYNECIAQAKEDWQQNARPALKACPESLAAYDTIYLGYPNYCGTMPMPVYTFSERFDFTGKTIRPFCTHEGSGLGRSESEIRRLCPGARVEPGLAIRGSAAAASGPALREWCDGAKA